MKGTEGEVSVEIRKRTWRLATQVNTLDLCTILSSGEDSEPLLPSRRTRKDGSQVPPKLVGRGMCVLDVEGTSATFEAALMGFRIVSGVTLPLARPPSGALPCTILALTRGDREHDERI